MEPPSNKSPKQKFSDNFGTQPDALRMAMASSFLAAFMTGKEPEEFSKAYNSDDLVTFCFDLADRFVKAAARQPLMRDDLR